MGYWNYYLLWIAFTYLLAQPKLLIGLVVLLLLRRVLPAPGPIFRSLRRGRLLRDQVALNPKNVTAARDLAMLELDLLRPRAALTYLEKALERSPDDAEILYLAGVARHRLGRHEEALTALVAAVQTDARLRFGLPYLVAGDALYALGRWEGALDAYERYQDLNSSDIRAPLGIARARHHLGDRAGAAQALTELFRTFRVLPYHLRTQSFRPLLGAYWARIWLLREPGAIVIGALAIATAVVAAVAIARGVPALLVFFSRPTLDYDGQPVELSESYDDYDTYKNDPNNLKDKEHAANLVRTRSVPTELASRDALRELMFDLKFPGYGLASGIGAKRGTFYGFGVELPGTYQYRIVIYEQSDGAYRLVDDFVTDKLIADVTRHGTQLQYVDFQGRTVVERSPKSGS